MNPELSEIKRLRRRHSLTQAQLAKLSGVSQSLIAKVESARIDPAYNNVKKIFGVLYGLSEQKEHKASEFLVKRIISATSKEGVSAAIKKMKSHSISQLPVIDRNVPVGLLTESNLIEALSGERKVSELKVRDVMQEAPPVVSKNTPMRILLDLLRFSPLVIISDNGRFEGVVTKADILKSNDSFQKH